MNSILAAIDFSATSQRVVDFAAAQARASGVHLYLLHVASPEPDFVGYDVGPDTERDAVARAFRREHANLQEMSATLRDEGLETTALLVQGPTVEKILEEAKRLEVAHIVVGTHGRGALGRVLLGSVSEGLVRHGAVPVTVIPAINKS